MKWFLNQKTATKLVLAFVSIACLLAAVGFYSVYNVKMMKANLDVMYDNNLTSIKEMSAARIGYQNLRVTLRDAALSQTTADKEAKLQEIPDFKKEVTARIDNYRSTTITPAEQDELDVFDTEWAAYLVVYDRATSLLRAGDEDGFLTFINQEVFTQGKKLDSSLARLIDINVKLAEQKNEESDRAYASARNILIAVIAVAFLLSIVTGYVIAQTIARPLVQMVGIVSQVANGDLRQKMERDTKDEVGQLSESLNRMIDSLRGLIGGISASSQSLAAATQQISATSEEVAVGSSTQARSAQAIAELFTELSSAINFVAKSAEQAAELTGQTVQTASEGGKIVEASIRGMDSVNRTISQLEKDSSKIGEIIEVIDDIADQTNLLALNAAIEAARAGDHGRGFAVVADEVRKLAERSSSATKEITSIIKAMQENTKLSVSAVADSVTQSERTGEAFGKIVAMVDASSSKVNEIAAACEEEAAQASEVMTSVDQVASSSQESAAASEETAATCQTLANLAEELNGAISVFKIN
ncbi:methyl-accepting chemotaxis protein [Paenibacillus sp. UNCCL117]|nr:methyl-accepting chemotaxis protein [Paenibacillus sp. cl123]SFW67102.1 methyl-accepting chemotaxis protein [Paenibacillus sp. UNCCL117]